MMLFMLSLTAVLSAKAAPLDAIHGIHIGSTLARAEKLLGPGGGRKTKDGGQKLAWTLPSGEYSAIALRADKTGKIVWLTGFVRPGHEKPFSALGSLEIADHNATAAIWSVRSPKGVYRLVAKGGQGKASVIYMFNLDK